MSDYCYRLSNKNRTVLYLDYTSNLERRIEQHKNGITNGKNPVAKELA